MHLTDVLSNLIFAFSSLQLVTTQKEMQKQMSNIVAVPVSKECRRLETTLGRSIEKALKANTDALWARFQEENAKTEKLFRDRTQQITNMISNFVNKDLTAMLEKAVKKEVTSVGPAVARTMSPVIEKTISSAISESFQVRKLRFFYAYCMIFFVGLLIHWTAERSW